MIAFQACEGCHPAILKAINTAHKYELLEACLLFFLMVPDPACLCALYSLARKEKEGFFKRDLLWKTYFLIDWIKKI